jgi:hypothetical protein
VEEAKARERYERYVKERAERHEREAKERAEAKRKAIEAEERRKKAEEDYNKRKVSFRGVPAAVEGFGVGRVPVRWWCQGTGLGLACRFLYLPLPCKDSTV